MKGHHQLASLDGNSAFDELEPIFKNWEPDWWHVFFEHRSWDKAYDDFVGSWDNVRYTPGASPLDNALRRSEDAPIEIPGSRSPGYAKFVSLAVALQEQSGDRPIFLPVEKMAKLLGTEKMTISRYRKQALRTGVLHQVKRHTFSAASGRGEATEFHCVARDQLPWIQKSENTVAPELTDDYDFAQDAEDF
jgi:hypothetical protein